MRRIRLLSPCVTASGHVKQTGSDPPALAGRNFDFNHGYSGDLLYGLTLIFSVDQLTAYMPAFGIFSNAEIWSSNDITSKSRRRADFRPPALFAC